MYLTVISINNVWIYFNFNFHQFPPSLLFFFRPRTFPTFFIVIVYNSQVEISNHTFRNYTFSKFSDFVLCTGNDRGLLYFVLENNGQIAYRKRVILNKFVEFHSSFCIWTLLIYFYLVNFFPILHFMRFLCIRPVEFLYQTKKLGTSCVYIRNFCVNLNIWIEI